MMWLPSSASPTMGRCRGDSGQVGGFEMVVFGLLVFVGGSLLVATVWSVIDVKLAMHAATRDAARAFVEASDPAAAEANAAHALHNAVEAHGRDPLRVRDLSITTDGAFGRCTRVRITAAYPLPAVSIPWIRTSGENVIVRATHSELVDPYRSGVGGVSACSG